MASEWLSYGPTKTANILHTVELEQRLGPGGVHAYAAHPGTIQTELSRHMDQADWDMLQGQADAGAFTVKTVPAGAATSIYAATAPEPEGRGGFYLYDCQIAEVNDDGEGVRSYAVDPEAGKRLWKVSVEMVGQSFPV